jgi:hypothetical protein
MSDALRLGSVELAAWAARIFAPHAFSTAGVGVGVPPGIVTCPLEPSPGSGRPGMPCWRAHAIAARAKAKLPVAALG